MLALQIGVRDDTVALEKVIKSNPNAQATRADQQASHVLSDREEEIVKEARAGLNLLEEEGFRRGLRRGLPQVKGDMETVASRLRKTDTGVVTVTIEKQIIDTLKEMIECSKKRKANQKGQRGGGGRDAASSAIDRSARRAEDDSLHAEARSIPARICTASNTLANRCRLREARFDARRSANAYEQIQKELKDLSKRQQRRSASVTHDIATGKNEAK